MRFFVFQYPRPMHFCLQHRRPKEVGTRSNCVCSPRWLFTRNSRLLALVLCLNVALVLPALVHAATGGDAVIYPDSTGQLITGWGYDIKEGGKASGLTAAYARALFVTNRMNCLRLPIYGDASNPAHPAPGAVVGSYYADTLYAMTNARAANSNILLFASKKLDGQSTFPGWTKDSNGIVASQYAIMLADYLQFMQTNGFTMDILGIDNERSGNEGNITASTFDLTIAYLIPEAARRGLTIPRLLIGPENYGPDTNWLTNLKANIWGNPLGIIGTHYYPQDRPLGKLRALVQLAEGLPVWNSEVHWRNLSSPSDVIDEAQQSIGGIFDCIDSGLSGYVWWAYGDGGTVQAQMQQALTTNLVNTRPVYMDDVDGPSASTQGQLITRAFASASRLVVWAINDNTNSYDNYGFRLMTGVITTNVGYVQWTASSVTTGTASVTTSNIFRLTLPGRTVTMFTAPYDSLAVLTISRSNSNIVVSWPYPSGNFVLQQSSDLNNGNWETSSITINTNGAINTLTVSNLTNSLFFRLVAP